jgi:hypothetical protein
MHFECHCNEHTKNSKDQIYNNHFMFSKMFQLYITEDNAAVPSPF